MGTSRLPNEVPIPAAIKRQSWVFGFGVISGVLSVGAFSNGDGGAGVILAATAIGLFWIGSKIKTHKRAVAEGKVYR